MGSRRVDLADRGVLELVEKIIDLERELAHARRELARTMCGALVGAERSCQRVRGHVGPHAWQEHDGTSTLVWSKCVIPPEQLIAG